MKIPCDQHVEDSEMTGLSLRQTCVHIHRAEIRGCEWPPQALSLPVRRTCVRRIWPSVRRNIITVELMLSKNDPEPLNLKKSWNRNHSQPRNPNARIVSESNLFFLYNGSPLTWICSFVCIHWRHERAYLVRIPRGLWSHTLTRSRTSKGTPKALVTACPTNNGSVCIGKIWEIRESGIHRIQGETSHRIGTLTLFVKTKTWTNTIQLPKHE